MLMFLLQGGSGRSLGTATNEDTHLIWGYRLGRQSAYLHFFHFRSWQPAKPRTGMTVYWFSQPAFLFQQEPSLDIFNRNHRSTVCTGTIARISLFCSSVEDPCSVTAICNFPFFLRYFWYSVRTEFPGLSMRTEHQLLNLIFHWTLVGLDLLFGVFCTPGTLHITIREVVLIQVCVKSPWACKGVCV